MAKGWLLLLAAVGEIVSSMQTTEVAGAAVATPQTGFVRRRMRLNHWLAARRVHHENKHVHRSTSSDSHESREDDDKDSDSIGITSREDEVDSAVKTKMDAYMPKSSEERKGWRKWHRKCTPCPDDQKLKWRNPEIKWICGAYQRARRSFKSLCSMHLRNCQDGTMFTKIHDHRCPDDKTGRFGEHFFYEYRVLVEDDSSDDLTPDIDESVASGHQVDDDDSGDMRRQAGKDGRRAGVKRRRTGVKRRRTGVGKKNSGAGVRRKSANRRLGLLGRRNMEGVLPAMRARLFARALQAGRARLAAARANSENVSSSIPILTSIALARRMRSQTIPRSSTVKKMNRSRLDLTRPSSNSIIRTTTISNGSISIATRLVSSRTINESIVTTTRGVKVTNVTPQRTPRIIFIPYRSRKPWRIPQRG